MSDYLPEVTPGEAWARVGIAFGIVLMLIGLGFALASWGVR